MSAQAQIRNPMVLVEGVHVAPQITKLVYIVGRYPELTTTFIDREISALRQLGDVEIQPVSIRYPVTPGSLSPEHQAVRRETLYLIPKSWAQFNFPAFIAALAFSISLWR